MSEHEMLDAYADMMDAAFDAGRSAFQRGAGLDNCPYEDRRLKNNWSLGFARAKRDAEYAP